MSVMMKEVHSMDEIPLRFSIGYAVYKKDAEDYHALLKAADERMYLKKGTKGRNVRR